MEEPEGIEMAHRSGKGRSSYSVEEQRNGSRSPEDNTNVKDDRVMASMGKKQQMNRIFGFLPILALSATLLSSWEAVGASFYAGLYNGGPVALTYGIMLSISGTLALAASLAEMSSMCPIAGAQYHWTYIFAPPRIAPFMAWMQGWVTVFAWQATLTSVTFLAATQIQGLLILNYDTYVAHRWHGTLLMWAIMALTLLVNIWGFRLLPAIELLGGISHVAFFFALLIPLVLLSRRSSNEFVWETFLSQGGWESSGVSYSIGLLTVVYCFVGFDGAIHMSEETRDAATTIPKVLLLTIGINGALAFAFLIAVLYSIGNVNAALRTSTGYPIIEIFYQATGSKHAASAMESAIIIVACCAIFGTLASVSRLTWAFARDGGLPFSKFFAHVDLHHRIPTRAIALVTVVVVLLSLINIGSSTALNAVLSLSTLGLYVSYLIPISLLFLKRLRREHITFGPFRLGKCGFWINAYAIVFGVYVSIFLPFPGQVPVTAGTMNYAGPVFGVVLILAVLDWVFRGRRYYDGPIQETAAGETP